MKKILLTISTLFIFISASIYAQPWVAWDSDAGLMRLQSSQSKENFWKLNRYYESQMRLTFCGIAASVMVLNSLNIKAPPSQFLGKYTMFTQEEFFSPGVQKVVAKSDVERRGISMDEIIEVYKIFNVKATKYEAQNLSHDQMRSVLVAALKNPNQRVLVLYHRKALEQAGTGHWSPVAAYDESSDTFLMMDVAKFKYPPLWAEATALFNGMQIPDSSGRSRGFLIIEKLEEPTPTPEPIKEPTIEPDPVKKPTNEPEPVKEPIVEPTPETGKEPQSGDFSQNNPAPVPSQNFSE